jgi:hypothetical protein
LRIFIRTSKWAIWARRLASLSIPLLFLPVVLYRIGQIDNAMFLASLAVAFGAVALTLVLAVVAIAHLWNSGYLGWPMAVFALFVGLICIAPFAYAGFQIERYPFANDVATAPRETLPLVLDAVTRAMASPVPLPAEEAAIAFPNAHTRNYPLTAEQTYEMVLLLVTQRGWDVRLSRAPSGIGSDGRLNARVTTLIGWRDEVVLHIRPDADGSEVDMRSVSLDAPHDLGGNGRRIEDFLGTLDAEITTLLRDSPSITQPVPDAEADEPPPVEAGD